jgi:hypothetical protein
VGGSQILFLYINEMNVVFLLLHPYIQGTCVVYVCTCTSTCHHPSLDLFYFLLLPLTCCTTLRLHFFGMPQMPIKASTLLCSPNIANSANICGAHGHIPTPYYQPPLLSNNLFCSCLFFWNDPGGVERCCHIDKGFHLQLPFQDSIQPHF